MINLFDVRWAALELADVRAFLEGDTGEEGVTWEAKADDERGRLRPDSLAKASCGLANQVGGFVLIGAKQEKKGGPWSLPGITLPRDEPTLWIGKIIRGLNPTPRHEAKPWMLDDGRLVAVVWVDPVDEPPCMTRRGQVYERVSGETIPSMIRPAWSVFKAGHGPFGHLVEPDDITRWPQQDAFGVIASFDERLALNRPPGAHRQQRSAWMVQGTWDGAVAASVAFGPAAVEDLGGFDQVVLPCWREIVPLVQQLGGYGPAHLTVRIDVSPDRPKTMSVVQEGVAFDPPPPPPPSTLYARMEEHTRMGRSVNVAEPDLDIFAGLQRELHRAAGQESWEPADAGRLRE
jgi:hypothetical protein